MAGPRTPRGSETGAIAKTARGRLDRLTTGLTSGAGTQFMFPGTARASRGQTGTPLTFSRSEEIGIRVLDAVTSPERWASLLRKEKK